MNKLEKYLSLAGGVLGAGTLNGQINYTDLNPDITLDLNNSPTQYSLDIDQDLFMSLDFQVQGWRTSSSSSWTSMISTGYSGYYYTASGRSQTINSYWKVIGLLGNKRLAKTIFPPTNSLTKFQSGALIDDVSSQIFGSGGVVHSFDFYSYSFNSVGMSSSSVIGNWQIGDTNFVGVQIDDSGALYHGWIRISRDNNDQLTIHDMAMNTVPNVPIIAGDTTGSSVGLVNNEDKLLRLLKGPEKLIIQALPLITDFELIITNSSGKTMWSGKGKPGERIDISLSDWSSGTYVVHIQTEKGEAIRRKILH
jgi:hypothetical protein